MGRQGIKALGIAALVIMGVLLLGGLALFMASERLSLVLGEEGFKPYDPLLASGSFDKTKWLYESTGTWCSWSSCSGGTYACGPLNAYAGVAGVDSALKVSLPGASSTTFQDYGYKSPVHNGPNLGPIVRTQDLRLKNFRFEFSADVTRCGSNRYYHGGATVYTTKGAVGAFPEGSGSTPTGSMGVELLWDDYELGHYQVKNNGVVVQEGIIPEGEEFYFYTQGTATSCSSFCTGAGIITHPRIEELFNCDLQAGEVKAVVTWNVPRNYSVRDLPAFKRFCPTIESYHDIGGVSTQSAQVYYALAGGKQVRVTPNEFWEIQYIADMDSLGLSSYCALFDVDQGRCTGSVQLCNGKQYVSGVGCLTLNEDVIDYEIPSPTASVDTITWTSHGYYGEDGLDREKLSFKSGSTSLMSTSPLIIDEARCPYKLEDTQYYPKDGLLRECFSIESFGKTFREGDEIIIGEGMKVKLEKLQASYELEENTRGRFKEYSWSANWKITFDLSRVFSSMSGIPDSLQLGQVRKVPVTIENRLPINGEFITTMDFYQESVDLYTTSTSRNTITAKDRKTLDGLLKTDYIGNVRVRSWNTLQTEAGGIAFDADELGAYEVTKEPSVTIEAPQPGFLLRLWWRLKAFFGVNL